MWCEQYKSKKSSLSHETKIQFRPLAVYHIFHNTDTYGLFNLYERGGIESKAFKKKMLGKKLEKKNEKKLKKKNFGEKIGKKTLKKKF